MAFIEDLNLAEVIGSDIELVHLPYRESDENEWEPGGEFENEEPEE